MIAGFLLIISGLLIAFFPHLLSIIVAMVLILLGIVTALAAYELRRNGGHGQTEVFRYIIRY